MLHFVLFPKHTLVDSFIFQPLNFKVTFKAMMYSFHKQHISTNFMLINHYFTFILKFNDSLLKQLRSTKIDLIVLSIMPSVS